MARKKAAEPPGTPTIAPRAGLDLLRKLMADGETLRKQRPISSDTAESWNNRAIGLLERCCGRGSHEGETFTNIRRVFSADTEAERERDRSEDLESRLANLGSCIQLLEADASQVEGDEAPAGREAVGDLLHHLAFLRDGDTNLAEVIERDIRELEYAQRAKCHKSSLLLAGSILEGVLLAVLDRRRDLAGSLLKRRKFPDEASLADLITIAADSPFFTDGTKFLSPTAKALATALTEHRDLIHPQAEIRSGIKVDEVTANGMLHLLRRVVLDLEIAARSGAITKYDAI